MISSKLLNQGLLWATLAMRLQLSGVKDPAGTAKGIDQRTETRAGRAIENLEISL